MPGSGPLMILMINFQLTAACGSLGTASLSRPVPPCEVCSRRRPFKVSRLGGSEVVWLGEIDAPRAT
ncbi:hypothetical protein MRX96_046705 [Rhipicephalus microplus]